MPKGVTSPNPEITTRFFIGLTMVEFDGYVYCDRFDRM
jgi:hypothetical protein